MKGKEIFSGQIKFGEYGLKTDHFPLGFFYKFAKKLCLSMS